MKIIITNNKKFNKKFIKKKISKKSKQIKIKIKKI
jgi:hypothetical protein